MYVFSSLCKIITYSALNVSLNVSLNGFACFSVCMQFVWEFNQQPFQLHNICVILNMQLSGKSQLFGTGGVWRAPVWFSDWLTDWLMTDGWVQLLPVSTLLGPVPRSGFADITGNISGSADLLLQAVFVWHKVSAVRCWFDCQHVSSFGLNLLLCFSVKQPDLDLISWKSTWSAVFQSFWIWKCFSELLNLSPEILVFKVYANRTSQARFDTYLS